jgi:hypothetical protein
MKRNAGPLHTHTAEEDEQHPWTPDTLAAHLINLHGRPADQAEGLAALHKRHNPEHPAPARDTARSAKDREAAITRLYKLARASVDNSWGSPQQVLGPVLYRALIGEELLRLCAAQDETISAEEVRAMAAGFWQRLRDDEGINKP